MMMTRTKLLAATVAVLAAMVARPALARPGDHDDGWHDRGEHRGWDERDHWRGDRGDRWIERLGGPVLMFQPGYVVLPPPPPPSVRVYRPRPVVVHQAAPAYWDWQQAWGWSGYGVRPIAWVGGAALSLVVAPPVIFAPPPIYVAPPPVVLGLPAIAPAPMFASLPPATPPLPPPPLSAGALIGAAVPPPIMELPPPEIVAAAAPPLVILAPANYALAIADPALVAMPLEAGWWDGGYITGVFESAIAPRRVVAHVTRPGPVRSGPVTYGYAPAYGYGYSPYAFAYPPVRAYAAPPFIAGFVRRGYGHEDWREHEGFREHGEEHGFEGRRFEGHGYGR